MKVFLDTNVFLYAVGSDHPLKAASANVLEQISEGRLDGITNTEIVQEILYVLSRRGNRQDALGFTRQTVDLFPELLPVTRGDILMACLLSENIPTLSTRDAVHLATMKTNAIDTIITADRDFDTLEGITRVDPSEF